MHHTRSSSFEGNIGVVYPKSAQMTSLRRDDRGRADMHIIPVLDCIVRMHNLPFVCVLYIYQTASIAPHAPRAPRPWEGRMGDDGWGGGRRQGSPGEPVDR